MADASPRIKPECTRCPVGIASGTRKGRGCRFADQTWRRDQVIYGEGDPAKHAWYIKTGTVILRRKTRNSGEDSGGRVTTVRFPRSLVGLEVLVADHYADTAIAGPDTILCRVLRGQLDDWLGPKEAPARTALELSLRTERNQLTRKRQLEGSAAQRTASWLCTEVPRDQSLVLRRRELADLLGMRAETLSRVLRKLSKLGAIEVGRRGLQIANVQTLQAVASGQLSAL